MSGQSVFCIYARLHIRTCTQTLAEHVPLYYAARDVSVGLVRRTVNPLPRGTHVGGNFPER